MPPEGAIRASGRIPVLEQAKPRKIEVRKVEIRQADENADENKEIAA